LARSVARQCRAIARTEGGHPGSSRDQNVPSLFAAVGSVSCREVVLVTSESEQPNVPSDSCEHSYHLTEETTRGNWILSKVELTPLEKAMCARIQKLPGRWTTPQWDELTQTHSWAMDRLVKGEFVEARLPVTLNESGEPKPIKTV